MKVCENFMVAQSGEAKQFNQTEPLPGLEGRPWPSRLSSTANHVSGTAIASFGHPKVHLRTNEISAHISGEGISNESGDKR